MASARGAELEREFAFGVVRQLFEPFVVGTDGPARGDHAARRRPVRAPAAGGAGAGILDGAAGLAAPVFESTAAGPAGDPVAERSFAVLHGLYWLCANLAERGTAAGCGRRRPLVGCPVARVPRLPGSPGG